MKTRAWKQWLYVGASSKDESVQNAAFVTNVYSLLAIATLALFGTVHVLTEQDPNTGLLELAGGLVIALNTFWFHITRNNRLARASLLLIMLGVVVALFITGGAEGTGLFWLFIFPASAFFLAGQRQGLAWVGLFMATIVALGILRFAQIITLPYSFVTFRQAIACLVVVTVCIYAYQRSREYALQSTAQSQKELQEHLDNMTTLSAKIRPDGIIVFANKAAKQSSGLGERLIGTDLLKSPWWQNDEEVQNRVKLALNAAISGRATTYDERFKISSSSGRAVSFFNFSMRPVSDKGTIQYVLAEGRDISTEKEVERAKTEFITLASHQLRTPISAIAWDGELLLSGDLGKLKSDQQAHIQQIYQSNQRMAALVDAMLTTSRLELGSMPITPETVDVVALAGKVLQDRKKAYPNHKYIQEDYDKTLTPIVADPWVIKTILYHLVTNAFKYTATKDKIGLRIALSPEKLVGGGKASILIEVTDTGYGIPKSDQSKIFLKLFRSDNIRHKDTDGTGLGLYIVKSLSEYVGGRVWFVSREGKGSQFSVLLPTTMSPKVGDQLKRGEVVP